MKNIKIKDLQTFAEQEFEKFGLSECRKKLLLSVVMKMANYLSAQGVTDYTPEIGLDYITSHAKEKSLSNVNRAIKLLNSVYSGSGYFRKEKRELSFPGEFGIYSLKFIEYSKTIKRVSINTLWIYESNLSRFSIAMELEGVSTKNISDMDIIRYISSTQNQNKNTISALRLFFKYLHEQNIINEDFIDCFSGFKQAPVKLPSVYDANEINKIENSLPRTTPRNKRDYAMLLLASRLGLRASDISNLDFDSIDWRRKTITLIQHKTKKSIELPLTNDVGTAIIDYVKNARPKSDSDKVFLSMTKPIVQVNPNSVSNSISRFFVNSSIDTSNRHHSAHALRHSLASRIMENNVGLTLISEVLGHSSSESTKVYLGVNVSLLMKCSLNVPVVNPNFYNQEGGWFYGES